MRRLRWRPKKLSKAAKTLPGDPPSKSFEVLRLDEDVGPESDVQQMLKQRAYKPTTETKKPIAQWRFQKSQPQDIFQAENLRTAIHLYEKNNLGGRSGKIVHLPDRVVMPRNEIGKSCWIDKRFWETTDAAVASSQEMTRQLRA